MPLPEPPGDLRFDILWPLVRRVRGQLARGGDRLSPGGERNDECEEQEQLDGESRGETEAVRDLDGLPGLQMLRCREVVDVDVFQAGRLIHEGAYFTS